jgi:predicted peptidase
MFISALLSLALLVACGDGGDPKPQQQVSDDLESLPEDTGGTHTAKVVGSTSADFGYYVYLPAGYEKGTHSYPLLIFLHGKSERGNGSNDASVLAKVTSAGPPKLIKDKKWNPKYPMVVVSPQYHPMDGDKTDNNWGGGNPEHLKKFIEHVIATYRVNTKRIYLTGMSHGGNGVYDYIASVDESVSHIAAAAPVAAWGASGGYAKSKSIPIWVFVGENDPNFTPSKNFVTNYNKQSPPPAHKAKLSVYPGMGHSGWNETYSGSGIGKVSAEYDPFDVSLYEWMLRYKRD